MANKKINELSSRTPALSDLMIVGDPSSGYSYKCTVTALATIIETDIADGYVTIGTTQTISGAKTFSNNLTLTSVTNAATTQTKFLTLNGSNVVNYRTGAQVLSDIGGQGTITLTTTGTSGAATLVGNTLNIPNYSEVYVGTVTSVGLSAPTGFSVAGSPITSSGTLALSFTAGYSLPTTASQSNWDSAYNNMIVSAAVTGTTTKTLTLTQQDSGTITASWTDDNSGTVTSVGLGTGTSGTDVNVSGSPITSSGTITLNIPTASATNRGALSSADWTTFNNKQNALTLTTTGTSGAATLVGATLNIPQYQGVLTNPVTGTGTTNYIPKFTSSSAIGNSAMYESGGTFFTSTNVLNVRTNTSRANITTDADLVTQNGLGILATSTTYGQGYQYIRLMNSAAAYTGSISQTESTGIGLYSASALIFGSSSTERMRLDASGNLIVGGTSAINSGTNRGNITINGNTTSILNFGVGGAERAYMFWDGTNLEIYNTQASAIKFGTTNTERMRLDASGNLGINTSSPAAKLDVQGSSSDQIRLRTAATEYYSIGRNASTGFLDFYGSQSGYVGYLFGGVNGTRMTLDASGNLGLGVSPSAWGFITPLQIKNSTFAGYTTGTTHITYTASNWYLNGSGTDTYIANGAATLYSQASGQHAWYTAPSGTAGNAISFTQAMTLDASGNLAIGSTTALGKLQISTSSGTTIFRSVVALGGTANADNLSIKQDFLTGVAANYLWSNSNYMLGVGRNGGTMPTTEADAIALSSLVVNSSGRVGIGTTSPSAKLEVQDGQIRITGTTAQALYLYGAATVKPYITLNQFGVGDFHISVGQSASNTLSLTKTLAGSDGIIINSNGNVGIGTTSPASSLEVRGSGNTAINSKGNLFVASGGTASQAANQGGQLSFGAWLNGDLSAPYPVATIKGITESSTTNTNNGALLFGVMDGTTTIQERMRITSGGELLINTTSDAGDYKLQVNGNVYANGVIRSDNAYVQIVNSSNPSLYLSNNTIQWQIYNNSSNELVFKDGSYDLFKLTYSNGNATFGGSIKTAAPSGGTAKPIKFGEIVTLGGSNTQGVRVEIDGTVYYLVTGYLP